MEKTACAHARSSKKRLSEPTSTWQLHPPKACCNRCHWHSRSLVCLEMNTNSQRCAAYRGAEGKDTHHRHSARAQHSASQKPFRRGTRWQHTFTRRFNLRCLTYKDIPLSVQVPLVGQAASHDIKAVVVTGLHRYQTSAVWAVHHLQQRSRTLRRGVHLQKGKRGKEKKISPPSPRQTPHTINPRWERSCAGEKM